MKMRCGMLDKMPDACHILAAALLRFDIFQLNKQKIHFVRICKRKSTHSTDQFQPRNGSSCLLFFDSHSTSHFERTRDRVPHNVGNAPDRIFSGSDSLSKQCDERTHPHCKTAEKENAKGKTDTKMKHSLW